jgi:type VI secretion system protein ImpF
MVEPVFKDRLQPALLDRLTDEEPENKQESREQRVISSAQMRKFVMRDVGWLLDAVHLAATENLADYPLVAGSVLNYGIPGFAGASVEEMGSAVEAVREAILRFEPRLLANKLNVELVQDHSRDDTQNIITIGVEAEVFAQPIPQTLFLKTEVDLDVGSVRVAELSQPLRVQARRR